MQFIQSFRQKFFIVAGGVFAGFLVFWVNVTLLDQQAAAQLPGESIDLTLDSVRKPLPMEEKIRREQREKPEKPRPPEALQWQHAEATIDALPPRFDIISPGVPSAVPVGFDRRVMALPAAGNDSIVPLLRVEPAYPQRAISQGIEGRVQVAFHVLPDGSVTEIEVLHAEPRGIFERAAVRAVARWKFQPRAADAGARRVVQTVNFRLPDAP